MVLVSFAGGVGWDRGALWLDCDCLFFECANTSANRYKGMNPSGSATAASSKNMTPQATGGFSHIQSRGGGEGGGQQMSVLLSWHEKVWN